MTTQPIANDFAPTPEYTPSYTLERQLAQWRAETSPERIAQLNAEWAEAEHQARVEHAERIRVKYGRGSKEYRRAAIRAIRPAGSALLGEG